MIRLTDEELNAIWGNFMVAQMPPYPYAKGRRMIAKAQLKKVVEIMSRHRVYFPGTDETKYVGLMPDEDWQALLEEVKE